MRATFAYVLVCSFALGCDPETTDASGDASLDAAPEDASLAVVCSAPLIAPCDTTTLASSVSCPAVAPVEGTHCALTPQQDCYYCAGADASWATQLQRPMAYCEDGTWTYTVVACGSEP